jgi:hypothetical protein
MRNQMSLTPVLTIAALGTLALFFLAPVNKGIAQEKRGPCPKPYIKVVSPKAGLPGDRVEIRGHRFGTEKGSVTFSPDVKAEVVKWTNTQIWVVVPQTATSGRVTVSIPCGAVSNTSYFKVVE